jgi:alpha-beta hydrolase superfamily lysophospholipase/SAM-dependent methyltransferase
MSSAVAPRVPASRSCSENFFPTWDGQRLFYRAWLSEASVHKAIVLFHRGHEHSGRFQELVDLLDLDDFSVFAWDARGHGRSPGERGYAESFGCFVRDADAFVRFLSREYGIPCENMAVIAHSVGAVVAATWVHDYAPRIGSLVLASPALRVKLYIPFALFFLRLLNVVRKKAFIQSYVKAAVLTHDPEQRVSYQQDPLITRAIAVNILIGMHDASTRIMADASAIRTPTLVLASGKDWVVKIPEQRRFLAEFHLYPDFFHDLFHERERRVPIAHARAFILRCLEQPYTPPASGEANRELYDRLARPLPAWSPRSWFWGAQRLFLKTIGRLSNGIRVGWQSGFDSGATLDYVYRNSARGFSPLGRMIDRIYLSSPGWTGIRQRKVHLEQILAATIERLHREGRPVRILDVAAGHGRYVLETMQRLEHIAVSAVLRDMDPRNIEAGRELAVSLGLSVDFRKGDAFDGADLAAIRPALTVGIVSGLYELFSDNAMVLRSLRGIGDAMREGGYLIYTNQPWHPQLEMIARTLDNREGKRWVMRCRAQAELDDLVRQTGFEKIEMLTDEYGIFTVSLAQRHE